MHSLGEIDALVLRLPSPGLYASVTQTGFGIASSHVVGNLRDRGLQLDLFHQADIDRRGLERHEGIRR